MSVESTIAVLVQALLENKQSDPVEKLLAPCRQQPASDQMVLFVRAITAAACLQSHSLSLEIFSSSLRADGLQCEYVLSQSRSVCICCICFVPAHDDSTPCVVSLRELGSFTWSRCCFC